jgi:predicted PurR-regulated permease PerM
MLAAGLYAAGLVVHPFVGPLLSATVLAVVFHPVHERIRRYVRNRTVAATLSTVVVLVAVLTPLTFLGAIVVRELRQTYDALAPNGVSDGADRIWRLVEGPMTSIAAWFGMDGDQLREAAGRRLGEAGASLLGQGATLVGSAASGVVKFVVALITFFFALRDGDRLYRHTLVWLPLGAERTAAVLGAAREMIVASFYGVIAVAIAQGTLCGLGVWIAGLPSPALWGLAAAFVSVLPMFGSALVWVPASAVLFAQGSWGKGLFMLAWGAGIVASIDNVVRPLVVTARLTFNPLLVFIAMLGGFRAFGVIGIWVGPVTLAVTVALFRILREELKASSD